VLGRFIDVDPVGQGASPYAYVFNNPVNQTDPTGEVAWIALLIVVAISAVVGAVAGAITYANTHQGNFSVADFFLYALVGGVSGAIAGATAYFGGVMTAGALGAMGVSTSTSVGSGIVVGAVSGAIDGAVSGVLNQVGVNLIENRPPNEGLEQAAWMGAPIGGGIGGGLGGVTGRLNKIGRPNFDDPAITVSDLTDAAAKVNTGNGKSRRNLTPTEATTNTPLLSYAMNTRTRPNFLLAESITH
jgi:hypothetical protein